MAVKPEAKIYTDGACLDNPGPGGWACVIIVGGKEQQLSGGQASTTNNRMELMGVINGLQSLRGPHIVKVYSDSQYVTNAFNKGWLKRWKANGWTRNGEELKNAELWKELDALVQRHVVQFIWVKGHAGNHYNEICDKLAVEQSRKYQKAEALESGARGGSGQPQEQKHHRDKNLELPDVLDAFEQFIRRQNTLSEGIPAPCGAMSYCDYCGDTDPSHRCAMAYIAWASAPGNG
jgi:ribonuclease HI